MGRARITGGGEDGLYSIEIDCGADRIALMIAELEALRDDVQADLDAKAAELIEAEQAGEAPLVAAMEDAQIAYADRVQMLCTPEGWQADPVASEYAAILANAKAQSAARATIYDLTIAQGNLAIQIEDLEPQYEAAVAELADLRGQLPDALDKIASTALALGEAKLVCEAAGDLTPECYEEEYDAWTLAVFEWEWLTLFAIPEAEESRDALGQELAAAQSDLADVEAQIADTQAQLDGLIADYPDLFSSYQDALFEQRDQLIACAPANFVPEILAVEAAIQALIDHRVPLEKLRIAVKALEAQWSNLQFQIEYLQLVDAEEITRNQSAWCVDLTEDGEGDVATIEVPGEPQTVVLVPGCGGPSAPDGQLLSREVMSPAQVFWNAAVLPGWAKWKPTYRIGTITALDYGADTASVTLDAALLTGQKLNVNQGAALAGIPVQYMECDADAFVVGDRVVVAFGGDWAGATVIGFESHPVGCPQEISLGIRWEDAGTSDGGSTAVSCETGAGCMYQDYTLYAIFPDGSRLTLFTPSGSACFFNCYPMRVNGVTYGVGINGFRKDINNNLVIYSCDNFTGSYDFESFPFSAGLPSDFAAPPETLDVDGWHYIYGGVVAGALIYDLAGRLPGP
jgi:hypothetical protein